MHYSFIYNTAHIHRIYYRHSHMITIYSICKLNQWSNFYFEVVSNKRSAAMRPAKVRLFSVSWGESSDHKLSENLPNATENFKFQWLENFWGLKLKSANANCSFRPERDPREKYALGGKNPNKRTPSLDGRSWHGSYKRAYRVDSKPAKISHMQHWFAMAGKDSPALYLTPVCSMCE